MPTVTNMDQFHYDTGSEVGSICTNYLASFPGPEHNIEGGESLPGIFSDVSTAKGRKRGYRQKDLNWAWVYQKTENREKSEGSGQLTTHI